KSSGKGNFLIRGYQNLVSYFNGFYNAKQLYKEGVKSVESTLTPPEDKLMPLVNVGDAAKAKSSFSKFDEAIKKCEVIIFRRKKSDWQDDCRFMIGRCQFYKNNYALAAQNFEYILAAFPKSNLRPEVQIWLAKTAYMTKNPWKAKETLDKLLKENAKLNPKLKAEMALLYAGVAVENEAYADALKVLEDNQNFFKKKRTKAQVYFLMAQLYDKQKNFPKSYEYYQKVYKLNVDNATTFQAQIKMARLLTDYQQGQDEAESIAKQLKKLANDSKYEEFADQIFYELALLELKKKNDQQAINYLKQSLAKSTTNTRQKCLSYYLTGKIYFYNQKKLPEAQAYFDSASTTVQKDMVDYEEIKAISATLKEYSKLSSTIYLNDSLLALSSLTDEQLKAKVDYVIATEDRLKAEADAKKLKEQQEANDPNSPTNRLLNEQMLRGNVENASAFYFDNPTMVSTGKMEFIRLWGERPNEDHWRRKSKEQVFANPEDEKKGTSGDKPTADGKSAGKDSRKEQYFKNVPRTTEQIQATRQKIIEAMFNLAQLYHLRLNLKDSAVVLLNRLVNRFPESDHTAKSYYALYNIERGRDKIPESERYKNIILTDFPNSLYARLIRNEGASEGGTDAEFTTAYQKLYDLFKAEQYQRVINDAETIIKRFPASSELAEVYYLKGASYGASGNKDSLISIYQSIRTNFPDSDVIPLVNSTLELLGVASAKPVKSDSPNPNSISNKTDKPNDNPDKTRPGPADPNNPQANQPNFTTKQKPGEIITAILLVEKSKITTNDLRVMVSDINRQFFKDENLNVNVFLYNNAWHLVYVNHFNNFAAADAYLKILLDDKKLKALLKEPEKEAAFITSQNFSEAFSKRKIHEYFQFFVEKKQDMLNGK
ncbi:MAG: tetratricopeptide repeat protein, partial [Bacteroidia bacterium]|nr:tetratricopeptide repeat protein [Bacteroidia bacterium]